MSILNVIILAIVQGLAELLPVSSSAHVIVAEKLLGLNPSSPEMTLLLVMLHTGTMFAVIVYFWKQWREAYFQGFEAFKTFAISVVLATAITGVIGEGIIKLIEKVILRDTPKAQIEDLFSHLEWIAPALAAAGVVILIAGLRERKHAERNATDDGMSLKQAGIIGAVQGLALPFRGFSRSGSTISAGMLSGLPKVTAEAFSFALAVVLTPAVVGREWIRFTKEVQEQLPPGTGAVSTGVLYPLLGAAVAFVAGLLALRWLSRWLEQGRWYFFGIYCLVAAFGVFLLKLAGY